MAGDVRESFLRLAEAQSAEEVLAACKADPRMLDPAFEAFLIDFEDDQRTKGADVDQFSAWRLVLRSVREGRNLYASAHELLSAGSARAIRDLVLAEPLLLEPVMDALLLPIVRGARQQGHEELAEAMEARRGLLARFRAHGPVDGYFDILVTQIAAADANRQADLQRENADLAEDFQRYVHDQGRIAANLGHHDRMQQLLLAAASMAGTTPAPLESIDAAFADRAGRIAGLVLTENDPDALRDALLAAPEMHAEDSVFLVAGLLKGEMDRAALDRDVVRLRKLWVTRNLVLRCAEIGVASARDELERGELWPQPSERI
jgi:hypothetical protein